MGNKLNIIGNDWRSGPAGSLKNQRGSAAVDYAVILVFVVLVVVAVIVVLQGRSDAIFQATATVVGDFGRIPAE